MKCILEIDKEKAKEYSHRWYEKNKEKAKEQSLIQQKRRYTHGRK